MKGRIRNLFGRLLELIQRVTEGSREYLSGELHKVKKFSLWIAGEIAALFVLAIVGGIALASLLQSFAFDLLMPFLGLVSPGGHWRNLRIRVGETYFNIGNFLGNLVFFLLVLCVLLLILKLMPRRPDIKLPQLIGNCPECGEPLLPGASECGKCRKALPESSEE